MRTVELTPKTMVKNRMGIPLWKWRGGGETMYATYAEVIAPKDTSFNGVKLDWDIDDVVPIEEDDLRKMFERLVCCKLDGKGEGKHE